jgi:hypothetical protein
VNLKTNFELFQVLDIEKKLNKLYNASSDTLMTDHHFKQNPKEPDLFLNMMVGYF